MLPAQLTPSPVYPGLQVHVKERLVLVQYASLWQLCCPVLHSSTNQQVKVSYKNFLDLNVSPVSTNNWYHDLLIKIHWENVGVNTQNKKILHLTACYRMVLLVYVVAIQVKFDLFDNQYFGDTWKDLNCFWETSCLACARITSRKKRCSREQFFPLERYKENP